MRAHLALAALLLWGCASHAPPTPHAARTPRAWEAYADKGPLPVRGARPSDPGPRVFRALRDDPRAGRLVAPGGEPETLEVVGARGRGQRIVLTYRRASHGRAQRLVVDPVTGTRLVSAPERAPTVPAPRATRQRPLARADPPARPAASASARQALECPIDPTRPDCRALCTSRAAYEWCSDR